MHGGDDMPSDQSLECQIEQYRQAAEDLRHFDRFIWQQTVASVLGLTVGAAAVIVRDISDEVRGGILLAVGIFLFTLELALYKHRFGTDTRTEMLEYIEKRWVETGLLERRMHRITSLSEADQKIAVYRKPHGLENLSAVWVLKWVLCLYIAVVATMSFIYLGSAAELWELPEFLPSQRAESEQMETT